jgi:CRISPR-associated Csx2 family protein
MTTTTLIGFLGRGPYAPDGRRRPYLRARYQFADWLSEETSFFLQAAHAWLCRRPEQMPNRLVVLGTSGSMWDALLDGLAGSSPQPEVRERIEPLCLELMGPVDGASVTADQLSPVARELSQALGLDVQAEWIPDGRTANAQTQILEALQRHVHEGDRVYLDVTHGYRHQPMLALGAAFLLSQLRGARIEDILYGANDMRRDNGPAPVISLRWLLDLLEWATSLRQLRTGGSLRVLPRVIQDPELQKELSNAAFLLAANRIHQAGEAASRCRSLLASAAPDPILGLTATAIDRVLDEIAGCQRNAQGILTVARSALREHDFSRAAILLVEAVRKHEADTGHALDRSRVREVKALRNALAHADRPVHQAAKNALRSRTQLEKTLQEQLDWLSAQV